jgi:hypothetical protein
MIWMLAVGNSSEDNHPEAFTGTPIAATFDLNVTWSAFWPRRGTRLSWKGCIRTETVHRSQHALHL